MTPDTFTIWMTLDRSRYFLLSDDRTLEPGNLVIKSLDGKTASVSPDWLAPFEITEEQARRIAKDQLGGALGELRGSIDEKLADWRRQLDEFNRTPVTEDTTITPNAASALFDLLKKLPGVLGNSLSGDEHRVGEAKDTMADLQRELKEAGIDLDERFTNFPDRLADLRKDVEQERADKKTTKNDPPPDEP